MTHKYHTLPIIFCASFIQSEGKHLLLPIGLHILWVKKLAGLFAEMRDGCMQLILSFHERSLCVRSLWSILGSSWMQLLKHMSFAAHYKPNCDTYCMRAFLKHSHVGRWKCGRPFHERGFYMIHIAFRMNNLCFMIKIIWFFFAFFFNKVVDFFMPFSCMYVILLDSLLSLLPFLISSSNPNYL